MKTFDEIQDTWNQQNNLSTNKPTAIKLMERANEHTAKVKNNHIGTLIIISITSILLICYFIWIGNYSITIFTIGLGLMISSLLVRILLEFFSVRKFKAIKNDFSLFEYTRLITLFYEWRKKIHYIATPIIYVIYFTGFTLLIPTFQITFSKPFFIYILISGYGFLLGFAFFLRKKLKEEMTILEFLKKIE